MITCIIIDDEQHAIDLLELYINQIPQLKLVGTSTKPMEAMKLINSLQVDLVFLDIQMPGLSGLDLAKALKGQSKIILTTAYSEFALESYELAVVDYLLKPIRLPRFLQAVHKAIGEIDKRETEIKELGAEDYLFVKVDTKRNLHKIYLKDIDYIEGMKNYVAIHQAVNKTLVYTTLKEIEERLPGHHFKRVHKSYIIALHKIIGIEGNILRLKNVPTEIQIGENYKAALMDLIKNKLI